MTKQQTCKTIDLGKAQDELAEAAKAMLRTNKALARAEDEAEVAGKRLVQARDTLARGTKAVLG